jgi:hypothetical protein
MPPGFVDVMAPATDVWALLQAQRARRPTLASGAIITGSSAG